MNGIIQSAASNMAAINLNRQEIEVIPFALGGAEELFAEILAAMEEVGGNIIYRAKVAPGGGKMFEITTGDTETIAEVIQGVVVHSHKCNAYFDEDCPKEPPVCSSIDGKTGTNRASGETAECESCPLNKYGTSKKGGGKACKNMIRLYILTDNSPIPLVLALPPTSIKAWQNYRIGVLAQRMLKPVEVITEFTLVPQNSKNGNRYSVVKPKLIGRLDESAMEKAKFFADGFKPKAEMAADDYNVPRNESEEAE